MKYSNYVLSVLLLFIFTLNTQAQKTLKNGYLKMEVTDIQSDNEQMMQMAGMLKGTFTEIYFTPEKSLTKASVMGGMSETTVLMDNNSKEHVMLMSMMGQKIKINMDEKELEEMQAGQNADMEIAYDHKKDETKEILGYKCHKVDMKMASMGEVSMSLWVTDQIKSNAHVSNGINTEKLGGFPLEYVFSMGGQLNMTMTATKLEKDFDKGVFNVSTEGYKEMTMEEFMESMGGMGGM